MPAEGAEKVVAIVKIESLAASVHTPTRQFGLKHGRFRVAFGKRWQLQLGGKSNVSGHEQRLDQINNKGQCRTGFPIFPPVRSVRLDGFLPNSLLPSH